MSSHMMDIGAPDALGAHEIDGGVQFAIASRHAEAVTLCVFDAEGEGESERHLLPGRSGDVWYGFLPGAKAGLVYGYRAFGRYDPSSGARFNPHKLLLDPYARELCGQFAWDNAHYGYVYESGDPSGEMDCRDNAQYTFKGRVVHEDRLSALPRGPAVAWSRTLIYELHVRGFTMRMNGLTSSEMGTFAGLSSSRALSYLRSLGVTAIELMPVHAFVDDRFLVERGLKNYWGYNTISYFAPHSRYASATAIEEMRGFVRAAHAHGLEVILDVVYNHTAEADAFGPTLSFRGLDNSAYYVLDRNDRSRYADLTGCGSTLNAADPIVQRLIQDSLMHWASGFGIDGFRFDLATTLMLDDDGRLNRESAFLAQLHRLAGLEHCKFIAEPWDASGGYQLGGFPYEWAEWNDRARDATRRFWRGDPAQGRSFADAFSGSLELYSARGRSARSGIVYAACHDGFTLHDMTRYAHKHNWANGEDNRDGSNHCTSCNYGVEGPSSDVVLEDLRDRHGRALLGSVLLGAGVPMIAAGDEFGRTQHGNNNAYAQDNETSWMDWGSLGTPRGALLRRTFGRLIALRTLLAPIWARSKLTWISPHGVEMTAEEWGLAHARCFAACWIADDAAALVWFNADGNPVEARMPASPHGVWRPRLSTADPDAEYHDAYLPGAAVLLTDRTVFAMTS